MRFFSWFFSFSQTNLSLSVGRKWNCRADTVVASGNRWIQLTLDNPPPLGSWWRIIEIGRLARVDCTYFVSYPFCFVTQLYRVSISITYIRFISIIDSFLATKISSDKLKTETYAHLYIKRLFNALHQYYITNNKDYALQIGSMVTLLGELKVIKSLFTS